MQDAPKAVWSIPYVSVVFFPSLKHNSIAYRFSSCPDCIFEIYQLWQSGFSRVYSNCYCSCSFELEIIKIGQSSHKMYSNKILNFQESTTILNACTKKSGNLLNAPCNFWNEYLNICLRQVTWNGYLKSSNKEKQNSSQVLNIGSLYTIWDILLQIKNKPWIWIAWNW